MSLRPWVLNMAVPMSNSAHWLFEGGKIHILRVYIYYRKPTIDTGCVRLDPCSVSEREFCLWQPISCRNDNTDGFCAIHVLCQRLVLSPCTSLVPTTPLHDRFLSWFIGCSFLMLGRGQGWVWAHVPRYQELSSLWVPDYQHEQKL